MNEVFAWLKAQPGGGGFGSTAIKWVSTVSVFISPSSNRALTLQELLQVPCPREGKLVGRYAPTTTPAALKSAIEDELKKA
jgi:hypothetical protein